MLMLSLGIAFFYATYEAIDNIVAEQSRVQQQAVSPVFKLVRDELLRPLYIAETFASSIDFTTTMDSAELDEEALLRRLQGMEQDLGLRFFVASERSRKQYFSDIEGAYFIYHMNGMDGDHASTRILVIQERCQLLNLRPAVWNVSTQFMRLQLLISPIPLMLCSRL